MPDLFCGNCAHYRQHYILSKACCEGVNCGHCVYPRLKHRKPNDKVCTNYQYRNNPPGLPNRQQVIQFLTKEMLQYILSIDLPPEIKNDG